MAGKPYLPVLTGTQPLNKLAQRWYSSFLGLTIKGASGQSLKLSSDGGPVRASLELPEVGSSVSIWVFNVGYEESSA